MKKSLKIINENLEKFVLALVLVFGFITLVLLLFNSKYTLLFLSLEITSMFYILYMLYKLIKNTHYKEKAIWKQINKYAKYINSLEETTPLQRQICKSILEIDDRAEASDRDYLEEEVEIICYEISLDKDYERYILSSYLDGKRKFISSSKEYDNFYIDALKHHLNNRS